MRKALTVAIIAVMLFGSLALLPAPARAEDNLVQANTMRGWSFPNETVEPLTSAPSTLTVEADANFTIEYTSQGMKIIDSENSGGKDITFTFPSDTKAASFHFKEYSESGVQIRFGYTSSGTQYVFTVRRGKIESLKVEIDYNYYHSYWFLANCEDIYFAFINTGDTSSLYINSQKVLEATTQTSSGFYLKLHDLYGEGTRYISDIHYTNVTLSEPVTQYWHDKLHTTIIPWGYDFTYNPEMHIDDQTLNMSKELYRVWDKYGVRVTQSLWLYGEGADNLTNEQFKEFMLNEEKKGHEMVVHTTRNEDANRTVTLADMEEFKSIFGHYPAGWIDHGVLQQDLHCNGTNDSSQYYIYDWIQEHCKWYWVNDDTVSAQEDNMTNYIYVNTTINGKQLQSIHTIGHGNFAYIMKGDHNSLISSYTLSLNKQILIVHIYSESYLYWQNSTGKYAISEIANIDDTITLDSNLYEHIKGQEGSWHIYERYEDLIKTWHNDYSVWFATTSEIVDRYESMKNLDFDFSASYVNISNPTTHAVSGVTIYTTEEPDYALYNPSNGMYYYPVKSNVTNTWNFVINKVPKLSELHLRKVKVSMPQLKIGSNPVAMWGDGSKLYIYAQKDGLVHVQPTFSVSSNTIVKDLTTGKTVSWEKGSVIFTAQAGHTYEIYNQLTQAINISIDWTYAIVNAMIPIAIFAVLLSALTQILQAVRKSVRFRK